MIAFDLYPDVKSTSSWEARCACLATVLCCRSNVERPGGGGDSRKEGTPLTNIAELMEGLMSHANLETTDLTAAVILTSAAQSRRRRLHIARSLLPVVRAVQSGIASSSTRSRARLSDRLSSASSSTSSGDGELVELRGRCVLLGKWMMRACESSQCAALGPWCGGQHVPATSIAQGFQFEVTRATLLLDGFRAQIPPRARQRNGDPVSPCRAFLRAVA